MTSRLLVPAEAAADPALRALYESAFPREERIPWEDLLRLVREMPLEFAEYREGAELLGITIVYPRPRLSWFWYFAVPAQKQAGVTKAKRKEKSMEDILKSLESKKGAPLSGADCEKLLGYINELKQAAKDGVFYRESLTSEVLRLSAAVQPDISRDTMDSIAKTMSVAQLKEFRDAFEKQKQNAFAPKPQLCGGKKKTNTESFGQFTI